MDFKDYYQIMGVAKDASPDDIKRAYRKLSRKFHPDVSKEKDAEARFKELSEAYEVLHEPEKRAAYDRVGSNYQAGQAFQPPPGWDQHGAADGGDFARGPGGDHSAFFEELVRSMGAGRPEPGGRSSRAGGANFDMHGDDQHARIQIDIEDSYHGAPKTLQVSMPNAETGRRQSRTLEFTIPKGIRAGQHIRLAGQGGHGMGSGRAGDLYLDVEFAPHPLYRTDGRDVYTDLPITPWEAALGAEVEAATPIGRVEIKIPAGSGNGRKLRVKGRGLPGKQAGDFYFVLQLVVPLARTEAETKAFEALAAAYGSFNPRPQPHGAPPSHATPHASAP